MMLLDICPGLIAFFSKMELKIYSESTVYFLRSLYVTKDNLNVILIAEMFTSRKCILF